MTLNDRQFNNDGWRYESRIKDKPNSQGTLFSGGTEQRTPESRQPRGYSPERYDAIRKITKLDQAPNELKDVHHQLLNTYARSTIPLGHFRGTAIADRAVGTGDASGKYVYPPTHEVLNNPQMDKHSGDAGGTYTRGRNYENQGEIKIRGGNETGYTPIHEMGHHFSAISGNDHSVGYGRTSQQRGQEEAFADNYADTHARNPGYKPKGQAGPDRTVDRMRAWHSSYGKGNNSYNAASFEMGYAAHRPPLREEQFSSPDLPKGHIKGQLPLLNKVTRYPTDSEYFAGKKPTVNVEHIEHYT